MNSLSMSLIFGLLIVGAFNHIGINGDQEAPVESNERGVSTDASLVGSENSLFEVFGNLWKPKPMDPAAKPMPIQMRTCLPCKCGLTNTQRRIVGGIETKKNQYPWMTQLLYRSRFYCGATVINDRYVLTAAHCVQRFDQRYITVRIGVHDKSWAYDNKPQDFQVEKIIQHPSYSDKNFDNDIALIKLRETINFSGSIRPVCLAEKGLAYIGKQGVVTGYGAIRASGPVSNTLMEVSVPILSPSQCRSMKYPAMRITDNMLCAGLTEGGKDSCQGDSGGPLHVVDESSMVHRIVGVVSWGEGCALPNYPGVYARVNRYLTWIESHTVDACSCN